MRFYCDASNPKPFVQYYCLNCGDLSAREIYADKGFGFELDTNFPSCCAAQMCCKRMEMFQPCMFFGDDDWNNVLRGACLCFACGSFKPRIACQYLCLVSGVPPNVVPNTGTASYDSGAPGEQDTMNRGETGGGYGAMGGGNDMSQT